GWPLTVFMTPDQRPYFAGTYFPPADARGMPGFPRVLDAMAAAYKSERADVEEQAQEFLGAIERSSRGAAAGELTPEALKESAKLLLGRADTRHGGFGSRPKFPNPMNLELLELRGRVEGDAACGAHVALTLDRMRAGGIWDHLGGGFHRYSTDDRWLVPHFEKMLYDNALLLRLYADGLRVFGEQRYAETAREIVGYLFAQMLDARTPA